MIQEETNIGKVLTVNDALEDFLLVKELTNLSSRTLDWYEGTLRRLLKDFPALRLSQLSLRDLRRSLAALAEDRSPATVNGYVRALKSFLNWCIDEELEVGVNLRRLRQMKTERKLPPALSSDQIRALLEQPNGDWIGQRDKAMITLMLDTGIRVTECLSAQVTDVDVGGGLLMIRAGSSKSRRDRTVALSLPMRLELRRWLRRRTTVSRRNEWQRVGWLFPNRSGGQLSRSTVYQRVKGYGEAAGIRGIRVSPHTLRSTFATEFCRAGGSLVHLQTALGHSSLEMSRRYAAVADEDAWEASRAFSPIARMS